MVSLTKVSSTLLRAPMASEGARRGVAQLGRHLVADAFALVHRHALFLAPGAGDLVQLFFLWGGGRDHVVDEEHEALGAGHLVHAELLAGFLEEHVGVAGEVVGNHEIGPGQHFLAGANAGKPGHAGQDFLGHRLGHLHSLGIHNVATCVVVSHELQTGGPSVPDRVDP
jgi:hypothetical protein